MKISNQKYMLRQLRKEWWEEMWIKCQDDEKPYEETLKEYPFEQFLEDENLTEDE